MELWPTYGDNLRASWYDIALKEFSSSGRKAALYFFIPEFKNALNELTALRLGNVKFLFPVKSFDYPALLELAALSFDGFDVSNENELMKVRKHLKPHHTVWNSSPFNQELGDEVCFNDLNSAFEVSKKVNFSDISLRLNPSFILKRNRFGIDPIMAMNFLKEKESIKAIHIHLSGITNTKQDFLQVIDYLKVELSLIKRGLHINFGGGFSQLELAEIKEIVDYASSNLFEHTLYFEPGRWISKRCGIALGRVLAIEDSIITISLSAVCHLKWLDTSFGITFLGSKSLSGQKRLFRIFGPTCFEGDLIAEVEMLKDSVCVDQIVLINHVSGYSYGWNHAFNGIDKADVVFLGN